MNKILNKHLKQQIKKTNKDVWEFVKIPIDAVETVESGKVHSVKLDKKHHTFIGIDKLIVRKGEVFVKIYKDSKFPYKLFEGDKMVGEVPIEDSIKLFENIDLTKKEGK